MFGTINDAEYFEYLARYQTKMVTKSGVSFGFLYNKSIVNCEIDGTLDTNFRLWPFTLIYVQLVIIVLSDKVFSYIRDTESTGPHYDFWVPSYMQGKTKDVSPVRQQRKLWFRLEG